jgi:hypothetical protein
MIFLGWKKYKRRPLRGQGKTRSANGIRGGGVDCLEDKGFGLSELNP